MHVDAGASDPVGLEKSAVTAVDPLDPDLPPGLVPVGGEGDPLSVGRDVRCGLHALPVRDPADLSTVGVHGVDVGIAGGSSCDPEKQATGDDEGERASDDAAPRRARSRPAGRVDSW